MKTKTVVEFDSKEIVDVLIAKAKESVQSKGSGVIVEFLDAKQGTKLETQPTARVIFEWGCK